MVDVHALVLLPRHVALRHSFRISYLLWPRCLPKLCICGPHCEFVSSPGSGVRRRPDVGLRNIRLSDPGGCNHHAEPLARPSSERSASRFWRISHTQTQGRRGPHLLKQCCPPPPLSAPVTH